MVIDLFGLTDSEVRTRFPDVFQHVYTTVKPERDQNREPYRRNNWWFFGRKNTLLRAALKNLPRYISTVETAKHRVFVFNDAAILPDNMLVNIALDDAFFLGVLSARLHVIWALAAGGRLGIGNDPRYNKTRCFDPFPFPDCTQTQKACIRALAEELDAHRKARQAHDASLTLTAMYNCLETLKAGGTMSAREKTVVEAGLIAVLKGIHERLDAAVFDAYGWPADLSDDEILERLVALNHARAAEEEQGQIRWLRPDYQAKGATREVQGELTMGTRTAKITKAKKIPWPKELPAQVQCVRDTLAAAERPLTLKELTARFARGKVETIAPILETLIALGQAREAREGRYVA